MKFKDLLVGQTFDFIDDDNPMHNSFYSRCVKVSSRTYREIEQGEAGIEFKSNSKHRVGSINAEVFHTA